MAKKRYTPEQIVAKIREADVELARGKRSNDAAGLQEVGSQRADALPLAESVQGAAPGTDEAPEGPGTGKHSVEEAGGRPGDRHCDFEGSVFGKILSPDRRRRAVEHVRRVVRVSERRACRVVGQPRSTHRHRDTTPGDEPRMVGRIIELATKYGRYGYRRITAHLRHEGWRVNHKPNSFRYEEPVTSQTLKWT